MSDLVRCLECNWVGENTRAGPGKLVAPCLRCRHSVYAAHADLPKPELTQVRKQLRVRGDGG